MIHSFAFDYEVEALGQSVSVEVTVTPASFPGDPGPDGESEVEVGDVTLNGQDVDTDGIKVCRMVPIYDATAGVLPGAVAEAHWLPEWFTLTELIRVAAEERAEREAQNG